MREKELRLALVCYGGVSLAVYMHGITKEIWHLNRASRAHHDGNDGLDGVAAVYRDLFATIERTAGVRLRVLTDIVAGASAGGINGIFLAQAIATGQPIDPLTALWLEDADVDRLLDPDAKMRSRFSKVWALPLIQAFAHRQETLFEGEIDSETHEKLSRFMRSRWFEPPFGGTVFTRLLLRAFDAMAAGPVGPRLLPDEQPLDLFVTVTDFNGHEEVIALNSPPMIKETEHRLIIGFRDAPGDPATLGPMPELAFAARATASFPGAFPPFTVQELDTVLATDAREWPDRDAFLARILPGRTVEQAEAAVLIDGSILANAPFRPAIAALRNRPARREVDRRFVYIDPKPGLRSVKLNWKGDAELPGFFTTIFGALSDLPREQPIRDNLDAIAGRSARIARMRAIVDALRPDVEKSVARLFGRMLFIDRPNPSRIAAWRARADARAAQASGHSYIGYCQLRLAALIDAAPPAVRSAVEQARSSLGMSDILARYDVRYPIRRLRFVARHLAEIESDAPDGTYEHVRDVIYRRLSDYIDLDAKPDPDADLAALDAATDAAIADALSLCAKPARRAPLLAYLGFPFYDVATFALLQGEGFDEFDLIKVDRISPEDAQSIRKGNAATMLKGVLFNSFGAFFSRGYRENDYLWGRLHGAERLVDIMVSTLPAATLPEAVIQSTKQALFYAILDEEASRCGMISSLIMALRAEVAAMTRQPG